VHFDGFYVSVYFAAFPAEYLRCLRDINIDELRNRKDKIQLHHTRLYNLFNTSDRTEFIKEFVALVRFVAAGEANMGFLGKNCSEIHRMTDSNGRIEQDQVLQPPQEELNENEGEMWRRSDAREYTS
jgi:hypothetical protein